MFLADTSPDKMNLGIGAFRDDEGNPRVLSSVKEAESFLAKQIETGDLNHEYLGIGGLGELVEVASELVFGKSHPVIEKGHVKGLQALSGTGSLRVVGQFLSKFHSNKSILIPDPTWANHGAIFRESGLEVKSYSYYDPQSKGLNFEAMIYDLKAADDSSIILFHACAHNPTGVDPSQDQWDIIRDICQKKHLVVIFDCAYLGFASGDVDEDAYAMRQFVQHEIPCFICLSFSKNFGLYNERCGCVLTYSPNSTISSAIVSQMKLVVRPMWSNPPAHGARIVSYILSDSARAKQWKNQVKKMAERILAMRRALFDKLTEMDKDLDWNHVIRQCGMFTFTGLSKKQVQFIQKKYHIYMLDSGRINVCGIPKNRVHYLATAMHDAVQSV